MTVFLFADRGTVAFRNGIIDGMLRTGGIPVGFFALSSHAGEGGCAKQSRVGFGKGEGRFLPGFIER